MIPGSYPRDEDTSNHVIPLLAVSQVDTGEFSEGSATALLDQMNRYRFSKRHNFNIRSQNQRHLIQSLESLVYIIIGLQFVKFCYSAALFPVVLHVLTQKLISVETYLYGRHRTTPVHGMIALINSTNSAIQSAENHSTGRSDSSRSSRRSSASPDAEPIPTYSASGRRRRRTTRHRNNHNNSSNHVGLSQPSRDHIVTWVKRICFFIYIKCILVSLYHILFVCLWLMPFAENDDMTQLQTGTWWFISFIGELTPSNVSAERSYFKRLCMLGLPGLLFTNLLILFLQLILFQCIYHQSTASPLGRKLEEDEDNTLCLVGEVPANVDNEEYQDGALMEPVPTIFLVKLFEVFEWESFTI